MYQIYRNPVLGMTLLTVGSDMKQAFTMDDKMELGVLVNTINQRRRRNQTRDTASMDANKDNIVIRTNF